MATDIREELRRMQNVILRLSAEVGGKNQKLGVMEKNLEEGSESLSRMTEETDHLNQAYNEEKRKTKRTMLENERLMRGLETQRKEIEQQAKETKKRDAQLDFKSKQLLVLRMLNTATQAPTKINTEQGKHEGVKNMSNGDKVQVQIATNGLHNELEEKDCGLDNELSRKQTFVKNEHMSNHDLQEAHKVSIENKIQNSEWYAFKNITMNQNLHEVTKEDDEKSIEVLDDWSMEDFEDSGEVEWNAFEDMVPPIPPPESLVDPCNDVPNNSSVISGVLPVPDAEIAELEQLSTFVEDSFSDGGISLDKDFCNNSKKDDSCRLRRSTRVSVLKKSSSCSGGKTMPLSPGTVVPERVGSKRPQSAIFSQQPTSNLTSLKSCKINVENQPMPNSYITSESEYFAESHPPYTPNVNGKEQKKMKKGKKNRKKQQQPGKCSHCEITKTSQWREGPLGRGTLCNACGVRYRTGKLFPEYRPKASPTFVASIHSSYHKKVLEMRVKGTPAI
ncbi:hypothetical protein MKW98_026624 [Papaver atlanticum]|uniref:GATA-type domain-containing protein n=1 Tax=Papaver atlanticum TaxID=357466 RepID=A0AAD4X6J7_9MAGN|nr:hypothetical protein MKW98_026624 [Papaver atlanticum]